MDILEKLFGSPARVKLMRLFLSNPEAFFEVGEIARRTRISKAGLRREINLLQSAGLIKRKKVNPPSHPPSHKASDGHGKATGGRRKITNWYLNFDFPYRENLKTLLSSDTLLKKNDIAKEFKSAGKIKLLLVSGLFIGSQPARPLTPPHPSSSSDGGRARNAPATTSQMCADKDNRIDLLLVGDNLNRRRIEDRIRTIEAEIGQELRYAIFTTPEFLYRLNMYDKLIREILDRPHERLIDTLQIAP